MFDHNEILARLRLSPPRAKVMYFEGFLIDSKDRNVHFMANALYELYLDGFCELSQRKVRDFHYQYIATVLPTEGRTERAIRNRSLYESAHQPHNKRATHYRPRVAA